VFIGARATNTRVSEFLTIIAKDRDIGDANQA